MKKKTIRFRSRKFPIYPVRFSPADRKLFKSIQERFGVRSEADAIRLCGRVVFMHPDLTHDEVARWNAAYQDITPDAQSVHLTEAQAS